MNGETKSFKRRGGKKMDKELKHKLKIFRNYLSKVESSLQELKRMIDTLEEE